VSGFLQPGTRVDILFTRVFSNGDAATTTILQNVEGSWRMEDRSIRAAKIDPRDTSKPTVATVLVTQDESGAARLSPTTWRIHFLAEKRIG